MRRALLVIAVGVVIVVAIVLGSGGGGGYRVAAVFDVAQGIGSGQQVKIAGVVVGSVTAVDLVPGPKARIVMNVQSRFAPFRSDATCTILPEGLISENYVSCDPGTPGSRRLASQAGIPTVPVSRTSVPASLQELLDVFSLPTDDRLSILLNELGIATAGRGEDLNALLERSNPALTQARRVLSIVDTQRDQLATAVAQTNQVLAAVNDGSARTLVDRVADVARTIAARQPAVQSAVQRLPGLLQALHPGLTAVDRVVTNGTPLLGELRTAAPQLRAVTSSLPSFLSSATPALHGLSSASQAAHPAIRAATPVVGDVRTMSSVAREISTPLDVLLNNFRDRGGIEGVMATLYGLATLTSSYDSVSHLMSIVVRALPQCILNPSSLGCSGDYNAPGNGTIPANDPACGPQQGALWDPPTSCRAVENVPVPERRTVPHTPATSRPRGTGQPTTTRTGPAPAPSSTTPPSGQTPAAPPTTATPPQPPSALAPGAVVQKLLNFLLGR
jgi:virulence factor Mce-like protein